MKLSEYLERNKKSQASLGEVLGITQGAVAQWLLPGRKIPAEHCPTIEVWSGREVMCEEMRPDIDWAVIRNTASPELAEGTKRRKTDKE